MNSFEQYIEDYLNSLRDCQITKAMAYALDGGKRFRPRIIFAILQGMGIDESEGYDAALALELIQTYSLIHDDLPAMDNDMLRRGKPTTHVRFGEDMAILAGDALLNRAFESAAKGFSFCKDQDDFTSASKAFSVLSEKAGIYGMVRRFKS